MILGLHGDNGKENGNYHNGLGYRIYGVYGDLTIMYPKPYSIYFRGTISLFYIILENLEL